MLLRLAAMFVATLSFLPFSAGTGNAVTLCVPGTTDCPADGVTSTILAGTGVNGNFNALATYGTNGEGNFRNFVYSDNTGSFSTVLAPDPNGNNNATKDLTLGDLSYVPNANIPNANLAGGGAFRFFFDANEPGNDQALIRLESFQIFLYDPVTMETDPMALFSWSGILDLLADGPGTNASDMTLLIPIFAFQGLGLTPEQNIRFSWAVSAATSGREEWEFSSTGEVPLTPGNLTAVPLPAPAFLLLGALGLLGAMRLRRRPAA